MHPSFQQPPLTNFMDTSLSHNQSSLGFTVYPTFASLPILLNPHHDPKANCNIENNSKIDQHSLRLELLHIFQKDKRKYHSICDKFIAIMELQPICQNITALTHFINTTVAQGCKSMLADKVQPHPPLASSINSTQKQTPLGIFSTQVSFLSTIFSRDKLEVILQVHTSHQKVQNFLNFLNVSLQSFDFTNEKEWILMKDQIERYLLKYEKNISKLLEVSESQSKALKVKEKENIHQNKHNNSHETPSEINTRLEEELNLKQYKRDLAMIREKIKSLQTTMCTAIRNSFLTWYQKFQTIVENHKSQLGYICKLIEKAKRFEQSAEKYQIMDFLLVTRAKGMEVLIFLEQIYNLILFKLEESRLQLSYSVIYARNSKLMDPKHKETTDFVCKQQTTGENVNKTFRKFQELLGIKPQKQTFINLSTNQQIEQSSHEIVQTERKREVRENKTNEKQRKSSKDLEGDEWRQESQDRSVEKKEKKIKKDKKERQKQKRIETNIILKSLNRKIGLMQMSEQAKEQKINGRYSVFQWPYKLTSELNTQKDSSSISLYASLGNPIQRLSKQQSQEYPIEKNTSGQNKQRKLVSSMSRYSPKKMSSYEDLEPLSIEEEITLDYGKMNKKDSEEMDIMDSMDADEEMDSMQNCDMVDA